MLAVDLAIASATEAKLLSTEGTKKVMTCNRQMVIFSALTFEKRGAAYDTIRYIHYRT